MKKIVIGATEIEVLDFKPYVYDSGRGEKVLRIDVDENAASFADLKSALDGNEEPIQYFEDDALKCEYVGYTKFTATYPGGVYKVEMHLGSIEQQMLLLATSNERITGENARITAENEALAGAVVNLQQENAALKEQMENIEVSGGASWDEMAVAIEEGVNEA